MKPEKTSRSKWGRLRLGNILWLVLVLPLMPGCRKRTDAVSENIPEILTTRTGAEMVLIPGGWFAMGSASGSPDEAPVHKVEISPFWMDRYEVTQEQYAKFPLPDPSHFKHPKHPAEQINWKDAIEYCNERSLEEDLHPCYDLDTGKCDFEANGYRLPTEAEWEYACRAGTTTNYSFGDEEHRLGEFAWFLGNSMSKTHPVGQKQPNPWGLFDMHGNVREWCNDYYSKTAYDAASARDPKGPAAGRERVVRGGGWDASPDSCRSSYRSGDPSVNDTCLASDSIGFRCVRRYLPDDNGR
ncbi:MAG: formylglycine-generating enzyme family protein [Sedimentisphaerales bacterium]|nr:formylglycine-generating enzyme family protein [Sedimentisphaerales bacterium]